MNLEQTNDLLTYAAAIDNRRFDVATVATWQAILANTTAADAMQAAQQHFATSREYLMPIHIREGAAAIRDTRQARQRQADERRAIEAATPDRSPEVKQLIADLAASLPQPDIRQRALTRARAERGRPYKPLAKTSKGKSKPKTPSYPPPANDEIAKLAMRYLVDGYTPADVSERLAVSRKWCETATRFAKTDAA